MKKSSLKKRHFSLIELLVVIGIIGILSAIILPALGGANKSARKTHVKAQMQDIALAVSQYYSDYGSLPCADGSDADVTLNGTLYDILNGGNARGKNYYNGEDDNVDGAPIKVEMDGNYDNEITSSTGDTINGKVGVSSTYENETIKSWVK